MATSGAPVSTARRPPARNVLIAAALLAGAALWLWLASLLWASTVPSALHLPRVSARSLFSAAYLRRSSSYERFLDIDGLLAELALLLALAFYAMRGERLMRESAAGRIGTGILLGMLGFAVVWLTEVPFQVAALWWERDHGVSHQSYATDLIAGFLSLGGQFLFVTFALLVAMGTASLSARWWWAISVPAFAGLALLFTYLSIYLVPDTHPLHDRALTREIARLARVEGVAGTRPVVQNVHASTTAPNAESVGFGATKRLILWDTLLDGRFSKAEESVVAGHELGHLAHHHPVKRVGWLALFLLPVAALVALATRRRGGMARAEAVPLALFVYFALQLLIGPLRNVVYRREEAEADYSALQATRDPTAARELFRKLAITSLADPDPPAWSYVLDADHPTIVQRIAMVDAWQAREAGAG